MKIWQCSLCERKPFIYKGGLVRHLVSIHRKQKYPKDETLKSAQDIANECECEFVIISEGFSSTPAKGR